MTCKIVISIINYRTEELTLNCIRTVVDDIGDLDAHVVVVDNASGDGSAEAIAAWLGDQPEDIPVELVLSPTNTGFPGGHNQGMRAREAEYYLLLNSDAVLRPGFLQAIVAAADADPDIGLFAPRIETEEGEAQNSLFRFHSPFSELIRGAGSGPITRLFRRHVVALGPPAAQEDIEWATFACILLRGTMVRQVGLMDEGYFLYFDDCDYSLTARRAGWRIKYVPEAVAVHFRGGSGPVKTLAKARKRLPSYYYASRTRFHYKAGGFFGLLAANLLWSLGRVIANGRRLVGKPVPAANTAEWRDIWINFLDPLGPRRAPTEDHRPAWRRRLSRGG